MKNNIIKKIQEIEKSYCLLVVEEILNGSNYDDLDFHTKVKLGITVSKHAKLLNRIEV